MKIKPSKYAFIIVFALIFPTLLLLAYNLYVDPFQIIHTDIKKPVVLFGGRGTDRYQHAGIINNYPVRSIILGNSTSANYIPSKIEKELKVEKTYSLTMDGSTVAEQAYPARYAFKKRKISYVFWGISSSRLMQSHDARNNKITFPEYLYDDNRFNDLSFFLSFDFYKYHQEKSSKKRKAWKIADLKKFEENEFDKVTAWHWRFQNRYNRPVFVADLILKKKPLVYDLSVVSKLSPLNFDKNKKPSISKLIERGNENIERNIISLVQKYPDTRFDFVFTALPTLMLQTRKIYKSKWYYATLGIMQQFVEKLSVFPNTRIFGFNLEKFPDDLRLYKDTHHYHIEINNYIIEAIARDKNRLTAENIKAYIQSIDQRVNQYRLPDKWNPLKINVKPSYKGTILDVDDVRRLL